ncbi:MAG: hypothetical protein ABSC04_01830 [Syntrophobacteraceae bacterium]|jgi:hypothetical protein
MVILIFIADQTSRLQKFALEAAPHTHSAGFRFPHNYLHARRYTPSKTNIRMTPTGTPANNI